MKRLTLKIMFAWGIILALAGGCILFGVLIYDAFQKSLEHGLKVTGLLVLIIGVALAFISYLVIPNDYFKED